MPIRPRDNDDIITIETDSNAQVRPLYMNNSGIMAEASAENALYVDGKIQIEGMPDDVKTAINKLEARLDKLERFYERVSIEAQEVVDAKVSAENKDEWGERVFRIAAEVGLKSTGENGGTDKK